MADRPSFRERLKKWGKHRMDKTSSSSTSLPATGALHVPESEDILPLRSPPVVPLDTTTLSNPAQARRSPGPGHQTSKPQDVPADSILWDGAYDMLKKEEPELVAEYEVLLSSVLQSKLSSAYLFANADQTQPSSFP